ncbi:uncharacterized protein SCODWIG_01275 [Saccharomycodes ludwigii]|uniref:Mso1 N-terminal domain-containing protein n=1 Tax=Saccharomycodes ludwigii TaxID=36035 RepID=A0A376B4W2_9ASCO|nr:hypothetical protein SCDLUD_003779 [Saccharomycodes ludwigii]KAH3900774.1 hypothetical protein SCDLUD_003779 [Saccharomycodes ludwigii]SSD59514.1 uncharacterized protein SCODWIG_01275 [Saccharomycodes ludwigii]
MSSNGSSINNRNSIGFWDKFKTSTKSITSQFQGLSLRSEKDGDSPDSTLVHIALVNYYRNQEPFQGFPDWLGHKEELPDEQKILRKQKQEHRGPLSSLANEIEKKEEQYHHHQQGGNDKSDSRNNAPRNRFTFGSVLNQRNQPKEPTIAPSAQFQSMFASTANSVSTSTATNSAEPHRQTSVKSTLSFIGSSSTTNHSEVISEEVSTRLDRATSSSSMLMRDRLKRAKNPTQFS